MAKWRRFNGKGFALTTMAIPKGYELYKDGIEELKPPKKTKKVKNIVLITIRKKRLRKVV